MPRSERLIIGIDLGTSTSLLARWEGDHAAMWAIGQHGSYAIKSIVFFDPQAPGDAGKTLVGDLAHRRAMAQPENALSTIKRSMGKDILLPAAGREWTPPQAASYLLRHMKQKIEQDTHLSVELAVVGTPYAFNHNQNLATLEAARLAGYPEGGVHLIPEPTAAALTYGLARKVDPHRPERMFVFDLGGGTFDITVYEVTRSAEALTITVLTTGGLGNVGGVSFDDDLSAWALEAFAQRERVRLHDVDQRERIHARQILADVIERAKCELSEVTETDVLAPNFLQGRHMEEHITRRAFEGLMERHLRAMRDAVEDCLGRSDLRVQDIDRVLLVGGSSKVPAVQALVRDLFGREPYATENPQEAVVKGATIYGGLLSGTLAGMPEIRFTNVVSYPIGVALHNGTFDRLVERDARLPVVTKAKIYRITDPANPHITIDVQQGNSRKAAKNALIGRIVERAVTPNPTGGPTQVELRLSVSEENVVSYPLKDLQSGDIREGVLRSNGH
jgi:molecular chaperone DnaK